MKSSDIIKTPIRTRYLYGTLYEHTESGRGVEVMRLYGDSWGVFYYQDDYQLCLGIDTPGMSYGDATSLALKYIRRGELPVTPITPYKTNCKMKHV